MRNVPPGSTRAGGAPRYTAFLRDITARKQFEHELTRLASRDPLTGLLFDIGALGVVAPGLTVNDGYWELASPGL